MNIPKDNKMNVNTDCTKNIQIMLGNIRQKIDQCHSLSEILNSLESMKTLPQNLPKTIEEELVMLYIDLLTICKKNNIIK